MPREKYTNHRSHTRICLKTHPANRVRTKKKKNEFKIARLIHLFDELGRDPNVDVLADGQWHVQRKGEDDDGVFGGGKLVDGCDCNRKVVYSTDVTRRVGRAA
jgi:hypothetical protein